MKKPRSVVFLSFLVFALAACDQLTQVPQLETGEPLETQACARSWPLLVRGNSNQAVTVAQYLLRARGQSLSVDGAFSVTTETAVKRFQASRGLVQDGKIGNKTWEALVLTVQYGSKGDAVRAVQYKLGIKVDGDFGSGTQTAVINFQKSKGLSQDGIVGSNTWAALVGGSVSCGGAYSLPVPRSTLPRSEYDDPHHDYAAIDLPTNTGTPTYAITAGTVSHVGESCGYGILITTGDGATYKYCHLNSRSVGSGTRVSAGQRIGYTGNTGNSFGPHLHLEVRASAGGALHCPQRMLLAIYDGAPVPSPSSLPTTGCSY